MGTTSTDPVILLADEDVMVRNLLRRVLQQEGYEVITAADGAEILELSRTHPGTIDYCLLT